MSSISAILYAQIKKKEKEEKGNEQRTEQNCILRAVLPTV